MLRAKVSIFTELFLKSQALAESLRDVTVLSDQFRDSEARTRAVLENVADGIVTVSDAGVIESFNRAASKLFGYSEQEAVGRLFSEMVAAKFPGELAPEQHPTQQFLSDHQREGRAAKSTGRRKDGSTFPMDLELSDVQLGTRKIHIGCLRDISERQTYTETLQYRALHDDLTDLPNRVLFGDRVNHAIQVALRVPEPLALLVMDLNEFKLVNDTLGHQHGDALLKLVAERLVGCLREGDTVARLGGDEFGILPLGRHRPRRRGHGRLEDPAGARGTFRDRRSRDRCEGEHRHDARPRAGDNIDDLLRRADLAMYDAKRTGSGLRAVRGRAGGDARPPAGAAQRPAALRRTRRTRPPLPAEDRPEDRARPSASRR